MRGERKDKFGRAAATGVVALVFFVIGLQSALFMVKFLAPEKGGFALEEEETVSEKDPVPSGGKHESRNYRQNSGSDRKSRSEGRSDSRRGETAANEGTAVRHVEYEPFPFDPNIATQDEFERLGLSSRQAASIIRYREAGGKFFSKCDFKRMYTVSDSMYTKLEPYIRVTALDLNSADSAQLDALPGIGPYYASSILKYRKSLGGYSDIGQLKEVKGMREETYERLKECVRIDSSTFNPLDIWKMSSDSLAKHPYIGTYAAKEIERFKRTCDTAEWTIGNLIRNGILTLSPLRRGQFRP
ncbi:MAG: helix-hairpin-helix domain-containing protein [Bacteroidales bacterium]|jgi:competence ComEA-like helix-hairpin-helix protein|nr:helix-hairpin-helix domain-containing protein [Bacteroidales bacterium]MCI2121534.1 helix-hairpin-helix domain-containing protein [Bacteroidales bacterium]MCI2145435.1 helix-hairpin-helix domain-containing protein [Bacteroidales bacterium]